VKIIDSYNTQRSDRERILNLSDGTFLERTAGDPEMIVDGHERFFAGGKPTSRVEDKS
jgi:hypothetical protein